MFAPNRFGYLQTERSSDTGGQCNDHQLHGLEGFYSAKLLADLSATLAELKIVRP